MDFKIKKKEHWNIKSYGTEEFKLAQKLSESLTKELTSLLSAVVLFGSSTSTEKVMHEKDIDMLLVVNDVSTILSPEVSEAFRIIVEKKSSKLSRRFHINTMKLSNFWDYVRLGDPIAINMLRDGVPLYDTGIFEPVQQLLFQGRIRPTKEAVWIYWSRAPNTMQNAKWHLLQAMVDLYWAAIDSAHAALMRIGETPPSPSHVADMLQEKFVNTKLLDKRYVDVMRNLYKTAKMITHREVTEVTGDAYDRYLESTKEFIEQMKRLVEMK